MTQIFTHFTYFPNSRIDRYEQMDIFTNVYVNLSSGSVYTKLLFFKSPSIY
jgi:hypothetical protein